MNARKPISLITPLLLHWLVSLTAAVLLRVCTDRFGLPFDETAAVLIGNLIVLPIAAWMYGKDRKTYAGPQTPAEKDEEGKGLAGERPVLYGAVCFLAGGVLNIAWSSVLNLLRIQEHFSNQVQERLLSSDLIVQIVGLGILVPIAEELIFRGLTYRRMRQLFSVWTAVLLSALLFAVYHGNLIQMVFAFPLAVVLALVYEHGKLFIFPVLFHMGSNLTAVFLQLLTAR